MEHWTKQGAVNAVVNRDVARLETWLAVNLLDMRRGYSWVDTLRRIEQTPTARAASDLGL